jgi:DNA-binding transcriptional LysR family regulator
MPVLAGRLVLNAIIARFLATFPKVRLDLSLRARIVEEGFDFAVRMGTIYDSDLLSRKHRAVAVFPCRPGDQRRGINLA